jgi:glyoxylase I family protein
MAIELRGSTPLFEVFDMPTAFAFYCGVLGFEVVNTDKEKDADPAAVDWAWLRLNDVDVMLNTAYDQREHPPERDPKRVCGESFAYADSFDEAAGRYRGLRAGQNVAVYR